MSDAIEHLERCIRTGLQAAHVPAPFTHIIEHIRDAVLADHGILQVPDSTFVNDGKPGVLWTTDSERGEPEVLNLQQRARVAALTHARATLDTRRGIGSNSQPVPYQQILELARFILDGPGDDS